MVIRVLLLCFFAHLSALTIYTNYFTVPESRQKDKEGGLLPLT